VKILVQNLEVLEAWCADVGRLEVSGLGTCFREGEFLIVDNVYLLNIGSESFTQIPHETIAQMPVDLLPRLKVERHPLLLLLNQPNYP